MEVHVVTTMILTVRLDRSLKYRILDDKISQKSTIRLNSDSEEYKTVLTVGFCDAANWE